MYISQNIFKKNEKFLKGFEDPENQKKFVPRER